MLGQIKGLELVAEKRLAAKRGETIALEKDLLDLAKDIAEKEKGPHKQSSHSFNRVGERPEAAGQCSDDPSPTGKYRALQSHQARSDASCCNERPGALEYRGFLTRASRCFHEVVAHLHQRDVVGGTGKPRSPDA